MVNARQAYQIVYDKFEDKVYAAHQYGLVDITAFVDINEFKLLNRKTGLAEISGKLSVMLQTDSNN